MLQIIGTEVLREIGGEDVHCLELEKILKTEKIDVAVITDVRFLNERDYFNSEETVRFYIYRKEAEEAMAKETHGSEKQIILLKEGSTIIDNNSSMESLFKQAEREAKKYLIKMAQLS